MQSALSDSAIAKEARGHIVIPYIFSANAMPAPQWYLSTYDTMTSKEIVFLAEEVHGTSLAFGAPCGFAIEFSHRLIAAHAFGQGQPMVTVCGDDGVFLAVAVIAPAATASCPIYKWQKPRIFCMP